MAVLQQIHFSIILKLMFYLDVELSTSIACVGQDVMFNDISLISNNNSFGL